MDSNGYCVVLTHRGAIDTVEWGSAEQLDPELSELAVTILSQPHPVSRRCVFWQGKRGMLPLLVSLDVLVDRRERSCAITAIPTPELDFGLTLRELDVLTLITAGLSNAEIAECLSLSFRTVTTHIANTLSKLGVSNRTSAAVLAVENGLTRYPVPGKVVADVPSSWIAPAHRTAKRPRFIKAPLVIGAVLPASGLAAEDGRDMLRGSVMAVEEINRRGGIQGREVTLDVERVDLMNVSDITRAFGALRDRHVDVLTSGYLGPQDIVHEMVADMEIPYLHSAVSVNLEHRVAQEQGRYQHIFQTCPSGTQYAPSFVSEMTRLRESGQWVPSSRHLVVVDSFGQDQEAVSLGIDHAYELADREGWTLEVIRVPDQVRTLRESAMLVSSSEPAAALVAHYLVPGTVEFIEAFLENPSETLIYSIYAPSVRELRNRLEKKAEGLLWATVSGTYSDTFAHDFVGRFKSRFGYYPGRSHAGIAFDRVGLITSTWGQVDNPRDQKAFTSQLHRSVFRGVNGSYHFGRSQTTRSYPEESRDPSLAQAHLLFQIQNGRQRILSPSPYSDALFQAPPWTMQAKSTLR